MKVARVIREVRPRVLILPYWEGRHPDHYTASILGYEASFLSGLAKLPISDQPRPASGMRSFYDYGSAGLRRIARSRSFTPAFIAMCGPLLSSTSPTSLRRASPR